MAKAKLYIIGTPLGNRNDITLRALEVLKAVKYFFVEDSREFRKLLDLYGINPAEKVYQSYANHNMKEATERALEILNAGNDVGLCSDRGMPGISDPGALLVAGARQLEVDLVPVPGPSSVTTVLSTSGFPVDRFLFLGFLPLENKSRRKLLELARQLELPVCLFESPRRIRATVQELKEDFPTGEIFLGREMTKMHESFLWSALADIEPNTLSELGEYAVVFLPGAPVVEEESWRKELGLRLLSEKQWAKQISERYKIPANVIYNALQQQKSGKS